MLTDVQQTRRLASNPPRFEYALLISVCRLHFSLCHAAALKPSPISCIPNLTKNRQARLWVRESKTPPFMSLGADDNVQPRSVIRLPYSRSNPDQRARKMSNTPLVAAQRTAMLLASPAAPLCTERMIL